TELSIVAEQLKLSPEQCILLALNHFIQTETVGNAIEGQSRVGDGEELVDFPELKEEVGIEIQFHPAAMEELETLEEEAQVHVLGELIERISAEEDELTDTLDLVLKDDPENQLVLSGFSFGEVVYTIGETVVIYHIAFTEEEDFDDEDEDEDDELESQEDEEATRQ
ncbi:MAG TPA: hypothetical protein PLD88_08715, partial [Candidatus Berkiella sp.]|nr:hypothetical protein [Candidatus Berkiella sp.]